MQIAIIGSGATTIYVLKHLAKNKVSGIDEIHIYEKEVLMGMGLPYNPDFNDKYHLANITSEEIPLLKITFAEWLHEQNESTLSELAVDADLISERTVHSRIALGRYLHDQYLKLIEDLENTGIKIYQNPKIEVEDLIDFSEEQMVEVVLSNKITRKFDKVIISTGHHLDKDDKHESGYYKSPWPIQKILPKEDEYYNFTIGLLGASLSAFDVVTSLAHRHGTFIKHGDVSIFKLDENSPEFKLEMHSAEGLLPHLQYEQKRPMRKIYRYVTREDLMALRNEKGYLRIETYFDRVCRSVLFTSLMNNDYKEEAEKLSRKPFDFADFIEMMTKQHEYNNPFEGMKSELEVAKRSVDCDIPIYWKEALDDLMYTLNFHMDLLPAEDHNFFNRKVMPFLMNIIAALPIPSAHILLALHHAGVLNLINGNVEKIHPQGGKTEITLLENEKTTVSSYRMFVECGGDKKLSIEEYPFQSLVKNQAVRSAKVGFDNSPDFLNEKKEDRIVEQGKKYKILAGIDVDYGYRIIDVKGMANPRIFDPAFPHTKGLRPYSYGLQACHATAGLVVKNLGVRELNKEPITIENDSEEILEF